MNDITLHLRTAGVLLLTLASLHVFFPRHFRWREELAPLSTLTRQMFLVHVAFIVLMLIMMGLLSVLYADALVEPTPLARAVLVGISTFWGLRLLVQWFVYDQSLWRGQTFNTAVHLVFTALWAYLAGVYGWAAWTSIR